MYQSGNGFVTEEDVDHARDYYKHLKENLDDTELNMIRRREHIIA